MKWKLWIQRMIFLICLLLSIDMGKTIMVEAAKTPNNEVMLTEEFLTGTWVCSEGFVCNYENNYFFDYYGFSMYDCKVENGVLIGKTISDQPVSANITIIDQDTIELFGETAVRVESELGKQYQTQLATQLIGKWMNYDRNIEKSFEFKKDNTLLTSSNGTYQFSYELIAGGIKVSEIADKEKEVDILYFRIQEDTLSFGYDIVEYKFYREGSEAIAAAKSGKSEVIGDWIFASEDGKLISQWKIDSSDILTIDYFSNQKDSQKVFSVSRKDYFMMIYMDGKTYQLNRIFNYDGKIAYDVSEDLDGILVSKDSEEGEYYIKKAKTIYKQGKEIQRTQYKKFNDTLYPEVTAISVSALCMSNLWLDDFINIKANESSPDELVGICGQSYEVDCDTTLKNAKITFSYNESQLPYAYEKDLVIVRLDEKTGKKTVLKTTRNQKANKVAAKITKGGIYYLADSVVVKGGTRDITNRNPKSTQWARLNDTGDILSLIDLEYIKESDGSFAVSTPSHLASAVYYVNTTPNANAWIFLMNDIDLSGYEWAPMGWEGPKGLNFEFNGMVEGWDYTISNLYINTDGDNVGFLGYAPSAGVRDLKIINADITGNYYVGIINGNACGCGYYDNCYAQGKVYGTYAGTMIGNDYISDFRNCTADATVNGKKFDYLTSQKKQLCNVEVKDYITITMDSNDTFYYTEGTNYDNLTWYVYYNGFRLEEIDAKEYESIQYDMDDYGYHKVYLATYMNEQYVRVSNVIVRSVE